MSREDIERWEKRYAECGPPDWRPDPWITAGAAEVPPGRALDLACGRGRHALWLASRGHTVLGVDASMHALRAARDEARRRQLEARLLFVQADLDLPILAPASFDLIVVVRFLDRRLAPTIEELLRPGGTLLYATYTRERLRTHPDFNPNFLLESGELPTLFPRLTVLESEEAGEWACLRAVRATAPSPPS